MNGGILKSQKLLAELTIKLHMSTNISNELPHECCFYAQILFKKLIFQARWAQCPSGVITCLYSTCALTGLVRFLWEICLFNLEGETSPPYCTLQFLPFITIGVYSLLFYIKHLLKKIKYLYLPACHVIINQHQRNREHANVILNFRIRVLKANIFGE